LAAIGPLLMVIGPLISGFAAISGWIASAGGALAILSNPIGWVIGGILLLIGTFTAMKMAFGMSIKKMASGLLFLMGPIGWVTAFFIKNWGRMMPYVKLLGWLLKQLGKIILVVMWPFFKILEKIGGALGWVLGLLMDVIDGIARMVLPKWLEKKLGFTGSEGERGAGLGAVEMTGRAGAVGVNENSTKITIEDRAGVKLRTETEKGSLDTEVIRGLGFQGAF